jgi:hypothetical protein
MKLVTRAALVAVFGCALVAGAGAPRANAATCPTIVLSGGGMITLGGAASGASCVAIGSGSVDTPAGYTLVNSVGGAGTDGILTVTNPTTGTGTFTISSAAGYSSFIFEVKDGNLGAPNDFQWGEFLLASGDLTGTWSLQDGTGKFKGLSGVDLFGLACTGACTQSGGGEGSTPIPAALPLFASGGGLLGFLSWRRKRKTARAA